MLWSTAWPTRAVQALRESWMAALLSILTSEHKEVCNKLFKAFV